MNIKTFFDPPPIPSREYDWMAYDDNTYEPGGVFGAGPTKEAAIANLLENLEDDQLGQEDELIRLEANWQLQDRERNQ